jgi:hypothetical protein
MAPSKEDLQSQAIRLRKIVDDAVNFSVLTCNCAHHTDVGRGLKVILRKLVVTQKVLLTFVYGRERDELRERLSQDTILCVMVENEACACGGSGF